MWAKVLQDSSAIDVCLIFAVDLLSKLTILLLIGSGVAVLMRRQSSATRHWVWILTLVAALMIPLGMFLLPGWGVERLVDAGVLAEGNRTDLIPIAVGTSTSESATSGIDTIDSATQSSFAMDSSTIDITSETAALTDSNSLSAGGNERLRRSGKSRRHQSGQDEVTPNVDLTSAGVVRGMVGDRSIGSLLFGWQLLLVWASGFLATLLPLGVGFSRVVLLCGRSQRLEQGSWASLLSEMRELLRLRQSVRLLKSETMIGPLAGGLFRPFVLLPGDSDQWSADRCRMVLLHELAHIRRGDVLTLWLTRIICGIYWFHPLVWYVAREVRIERERACDDLVLQAGMPPTDYSQQLLEIARAYRSPVWVAVSAMTTARIGQLEDRVRRVLDDTRRRGRIPLPMLVLLVLGGVLLTTTIATAGKVIVRNQQPQTLKAQPAAQQSQDVAAQDAPLASDWPMWGGTTHRNNVSAATNLPIEWDVKQGTNLRWTTPMGSESWGGMVVSGNHIFVGTNNINAFVERFPKTIDLGCLVCFDRSTGQFQWQHSSPKLPTGRVHDWPMQGIISTPCVEGSRLWYVTNRAEVVCLDVEGFADEKNNGPFLDEDVAERPEADVIWKFDMMSQLGVTPHNVSACSPITDGSRLFIITGHGVNEAHVDPPTADVPDVICLNRETGELLWQDAPAGARTLHGSWSSPTFGIINGQPIVLMGLGDGWVYAYDPAGDGAGHRKLLWKFDCNPKDAIFLLGNNANNPRNSYVATPVIWENKVYLRTGEDPEHGEHKGDLWCVDPGRHLDGGDVSATLVYAGDADGKPVGDPLPLRRLQNFDKAAGEVEVPNPKSAVVWHYQQQDLDGDGKFAFEETLKRGLGSPAIDDGLLLITSISGIVSCLDARTGTCFWNYDLLSACWGSPLIADHKVYVGDEDGEIAVFELSKKLTLLHESAMDNSAYCTPVACENTLYVLCRNRLHAISTGPANNPAREDCH